MTEWMQTYLILKGLLDKSFWLPNFKTYIEFVLKTIKAFSVENLIYLQQLIYTLWYFSRTSAESWKLSQKKPFNKIHTVLYYCVNCTSLGGRFFCNNDFLRVQNLVTYKQDVHLKQVWYEIVIWITRYTLNNFITKSLVSVSKNQFTTSWLIW